MLNCPYFVRATAGSNPPYVDNQWFGKSITEYSGFNYSRAQFIFLKRMFQTIKYGLNDTKRIEKKQVKLMLYSFTASDMSFQTILLPKGIFGEKISQKIESLGPFLS